jgi:hypothetical protein
MKLKYYMRGLGIGIILTTLIFILSGNREKLTNNQIIARATELGMVLEEKQTVTPEASTTPEATMTPEPSPTPEATTTPEPTTTPEATPTPEPTPTPEATITPEPTAIPTTSPDLTEETDAGEGDLTDVVNFTIEKGMSSNKVSIMLKEIGLIGDSEDFNNYLIEEGKTDEIDIGYFSVPSGASYEEIADTITN